MHPLQMEKNPQPITPSMHNNPSSGRKNMSALSSSSSSPPVPSPDLRGYTWNAVVLSLVVIFCAIFLLLSYNNILKQQCLLFGTASVADAGPLQRLLNEAAVASNNDASLEFQSGGLDSVMVHALPTIQFKKAMNTNNNEKADVTDCAVCLGEFEEGERLRSLPNCGHIFHISCVDVWFQSHSNCPLCRSNVVNDFRNYESSYSLSMFTLLRTLRREDAYRERWHGYSVLESEMVANSPINDQSVLGYSVVSNSAATATNDDHRRAGSLQEQEFHVRDGPPSMNGRGSNRTANG